MKILGNCRQQENIKRILDNSASDIIALVGPSHIGKFSFIIDELRNRIDNSDLFIADHTIDSAREAISLLSTSSIYSKFKSLVINDADNLSEAAQDAYLKLFEEPSDNLKIILICNDDLCLSEPLNSRVTQRIFWHSLSNDEMMKFIDCESFTADELSIQISCGRPGLYGEIINNKSYKSLYDLILSVISAELDPITISAPEFIKNMSSKTIIEKEITYQVCRLAIRQALKKQNPRFDLILNFLEFASLIKKVPTINAEIYWYKACNVVF